jgi:hypothetical protein
MPDEQTPTPHLEKLFREVAEDEFWAIQRKPPREQVDGGSRSSNVLLPPSVLKFCPSAGSWIRTFAWASQFRRLARDFERYGTNRCRLHSTCDDPHHAPPLNEMSFNLNRNLLDWHSRGGSNGAVPSAKTLFVKAEHVLDCVHDGRFAMLEAV